MTDESRQLAELTSYQSPTLNGLGLGANTRQAIEAMAWEGLPPHLSAARYGIRTDNLNRAIARPKVRKALNQLLKEVRENAGQQAYFGIVHMSHASQNDRLRFDAKRFVAGVDGISPVQKVQGQHSHAHSFQGFDYGEIEAKDITPTDSPSGAQDDE